MADLAPSTGDNITDDNITGDSAGYEPDYSHLEEPEPVTSPIGLVLLLIGAIALGFWLGFSVFWIIGAILGSIFLHELGHFVAAKAGGMKATRFFIGFGPTVWSFKRGETEYGIKPIPAGAFVKIVGMSNLEEVHPRDEARSYRQASFPRRFAVAVAGSFMHFVIALVLIAIYLAAVGTPASVGMFDETVPWSVRSTVEGSAAEAGGLLAGDIIETVDGVEVPSWDDVGGVVSDAPGEVMAVTGVRADGQPFTTTVTIGENDEAPGRGLLGVVRGGRDNETRSVPSAIVETPGTFVAGIVQSVGFLGDLLSPSGIGNFVGLVGAANDADPPARSTASPPADAPDESLRPTSVIGIVDLGKDMPWEGLLFLTILLNIFVGVFNLLPTLPFDGGHVVVAVYERVREAVRGGSARYFADVGKLLPLTYVVVLLLVGLGLSTIYLDVVDPIDL